MIDPRVVLQIGLAAIEVFGLYAVACFAGAGGGVLIAKTYLSTKIKSAIKHEYDEKLEILKAELANENSTKLEALKAQLADKNNTQIEFIKAQLKTQGDIAIERLKSDLTVSASQLNIEFTHLHTKRAEVIAQVHADLRDAVDMLADYTKPFEPAGGSSRVERGKKAAEAINAFIRNFRAKEIYLPDGPSNKLVAVEEKLKSVFYQFFYEVDLAQNTGDDRAKQLSAIYREVENLSGPAIKELQAEFRGLLGYRGPVQQIIEKG